jgi:hypothetical protein
MRSIAEAHASSNASEDRPLALRTGASGTLHRCTTSFGSGATVVHTPTVRAPAWAAVPAMKEAISRLRPARANEAELVASGRRFGAGRRDDGVEQADRLVEHQRAHARQVVVAPRSDCGELRAQPRTAVEAFVAPQVEYPIHRTEGTGPEADQTSVAVAACRDRDMLGHVQVLAHAACGQRVDT